MEAQAIMDRINNEDPSYWPYGLGIPGHDGVYLIRDRMTKQAAAFVGWQQMMEGGCHWLLLYRERRHMAQVSVPCRKPSHT